MRDMVPTITRIESREFRSPLEDLGTDRNGFDLVYDPGETTGRSLFEDQLIGKNPLKREKHWSEIKRALRKYYDAPIHERLGTHRTSVPASTSTYYGDENGRVVPDGPGLGVDYDWDSIEDNQTGSLVYE